MVSILELMAFFEEIAPKALAEDYDNVGLLVEGPSEINKILVTLDADENTVCEAENRGAQLILSHHPIMFRPINHLTEAEGGQRTVRRLLQKNLGLFAIHTNYDSARGGLCDLFLSAFGDFENVCAFDGEKVGIGRIGTLKKPCTLKELAERGKNVFSNGNALRFVGDENALISRVAVCNGGGGDMIYDAFSLGAELYISGDFKHHHARFALENGINLLEIDHYDAEVPFCEEMKKRLAAAFGNRLNVAISCHEKSPWKSF